MKRNTHLCGLISKVRENIRKRSKAVRRTVLQIIAQKVVSGAKWNEAERTSFWFKIGEKTMKYIFWGIFFISLNFSIPVGSGFLGLLPGFIGFYLLWKAMERVSEQKAAFIAKKLMIFSFVVYTLDLLSITGRFLILGSLLGVLMDIGICYMQYLTIFVMPKIIKFDRKKYIMKLKNIWYFVVFGTVLKYVLFGIPFINIVGIFFSVVVEIVFAVSIFCLWKQENRNLNQIGGAV